MKNSVKCVDSIIDFVNDNFTNDEYLKNYRKLVKFFSENDNIILSEEDANLLIDSCPLLKETLDNSFDYFDERVILLNRNLSNLIYSYNLKNINNLGNENKSKVNDSIERLRYTKDGDLNSFSLYLFDIGNYQVLTRDEEYELGKRIKNGNEDAKNELVLHNLRLVLYIAKHYSNRLLPYEDIIQEGNLGLMKAAEKFDVDKGYRFSTYAIWWIKQNIHRAILEKTRIIKLPINVHEELTKLIAIEERYMDYNNGEIPSFEKLSELTNLSVDRIIDLKRIFGTVSLSTPIGEDSDTTLEEMIEDEQAYNPIDKVFYEQFLEVFRNSPYITDREQEIIEYRVGLKDGKEHTFEDIGNIFGLTRERIRQIEEKVYFALSKDPYIKTFNKKYMLYSAKDFCHYNSHLTKRATSKYIESLNK